MTRHEAAMWANQELKAIEAERVRRLWEHTGETIDWSGHKKIMIPTQPIPGDNTSFTEAGYYRERITQLEQENRQLKSTQQEIIRQQDALIGQINARHDELQRRLAAEEELHNHAIEASKTYLKDLEAAYARIKFLTGEVPYTPQKDERYSAVI